MYQRDPAPKIQPTFFGWGYIYMVQHKWISQRSLKTPNDQPSCYCYPLNWPTHISQEKKSRQMVLLHCALKCVFLNWKSHLVYKQFSSITKNTWRWKKRIQDKWQCMYILKKNFYSSFCLLSLKTNTGLSSIFSCLCMKGFWRKEPCICFMCLMFLYCVVKYSVISQRGTHNINWVQIPCCTMNICWLTKWWNEYSWSNHKKAAVTFFSMVQ